MEVTNLICPFTIKEIYFCDLTAMQFPAELATYTKSSSQKLNCLLEDHEAFHKLYEDTTRVYTGPDLA